MKNIVSSRGVIVFWILPIRCARKRGFQNKESRKSLWLRKDSINSAGRGRCFYYGKQRHLLANYTHRLLHSTFCKLSQFEISLSTFLTFLRLKVLLVDSFCHGLKVNDVTFGIFLQKIFWPIKETFATLEKFRTCLHAWQNTKKECWEPMKFIFSLKN